MPYSAKFLFSSYFAICKELTLVSQIERNEHTQKALDETLKNLIDRKSFIQREIAILIIENREPWKEGLPEIVQAERDLHEAHQNKEFIDLMQSLCPPARPAAAFDQGFGFLPADILEFLDQKIQLLNDQDQAAHAIHHIESIASPNTEALRSLLPLVDSFFITDAHAEIIAKVGSPQYLGNLVTANSFQDRSQTTCYNLAKSLLTKCFGFKFVEHEENFTIFGPNGLEENVNRDWYQEGTVANLLLSRVLNGLGNYRLDNIRDCILEQARISATKLMATEQQPAAVVMETDAQALAPQQQRDPRS